LTICDFAQILQTAIRVPRNTPGTCP